MKRFIFGFHRLLWWPKCRPASNRSLTVTVKDNSFVSATGPPFWSRPHRESEQSALVLPRGTGEHSLPSQSGWDSMSAYPTTSLPERKRKIWGCNGGAHSLPKHSDAP